MPTLKVWDGSAWVEVKGDKGDPGEVTNADLESRVAPIEGDVSAIDTRVTDVEAETSALPTIIAGNYTKRLANYGNDLQAAIADLPDSGANGGEIQVDGEIDASGPIVVPANIHLIGRGASATALLAPEGLNTEFIVLNNASRAVVADLSILKPDGTTLAGGNRALGVYGDCDDVVLDRLVVDGGFWSNIRVDGSAGTTPGTVRNLRLDGVRSDWAAGTYGIHLNHVDGVVLTQVVGSYNYLDGLKFEAMTLNVKDIGGTYNHNGQVRVITGTGAGDGIDAFAGGDTFTLIGTTCDYNSGHGFMIKTDHLNGSAPEVYGYTRNVQTAQCTGRFNTGHGMAFWTNGGVTTPLMSHGTMSGGYYEGNGGAGLFIDGRNLVVDGPICRKNMREGIRFGPNALYVVVGKPLVVANSQESAGTYHGIDIIGAHISIDGGTIIGVDADAVHTEADLSSLTRYHKRNVHVQTGASDVYVDVDFSGYHAEAGSATQINMTSGVGIQDAYGAQNPRGWASGGPGSVWINTQATNEADVYWVRRNVALTPNSTQGWRRLSGLPVVTTLPAAAVHSEGDMVMLKSGGNPPGVPYICVNTTGSTYAWKELVLA